MRLYSSCVAATPTITKKTIINIITKSFINSSDWIRTSDPRVNSSLLYRLSYRGKSYFLFIFGCLFFLPKISSKFLSYFFLSTFLKESPFPALCFLLIKSG